MVRRANIGNTSQRPLEQDLPMHSSVFIVHRANSVAQVGTCAHESQAQLFKDLENL
jgi:hypothetical protein